MKITRILMTCLLLLTILAVAGCDKKENNNFSQGTTKVVGENSNDLPEELNIRVYYPDNAATRLVATEKNVKLTGTTKYKAAMNALLEGTKESNLVTVIPKHTKLLDVTVRGDTAKVDFDKSLVEDFNGGSTGEEMLVGSIVNTLTEFSEIKKVQILVEGRSIESIKGHMDTSKPLKRMDELLK